MPGKRKRKVQRVKPTNPRDLKRQTLAREMKIAATNMERHRSFWRETFTRMEMPDIGKKIEMVWSCLEQAFDFQDYSISLLLDALQEAEDQRRKTNGVHVDAIDRSFDAHEARLSAADAFFRQRVETLFVDRTREFDETRSYRNKDEINLRKINVLVNYRIENRLNAARSTAISKVNGFVEDGKNERRLITAQLQKQVEDLWDRLRSTFSDYRTSTDERRRSYEIIQRKDKYDRQAIIEQGLRIAYLLDEIAKFRGKIHFYKKNIANELHDALQECHFFRNVYRRANVCFVFGRKQDKQRATTMSKEYNGSVKRLKGLTRKAERILAYIEICRKYETREEKILPPIVVHDSSQAESTPEDDTLPFGLVENFIRVTEDFETLVRFWHRFGYAQLIAAELNKQRNLLAMKAVDLRKAIKLFLTETSYSTPSTHPQMQYTKTARIEELRVP